MASLLTKKMMLSNTNSRESLMKCSMLSPQLHIVSFLIRTALSLHHVYLLPEGDPVRAAIDSGLDSQAKLQGDGIAVATNKTYRNMIGTYANSLYASSQKHEELWKRVAGLLILVTARFVQAVYTDTKEANTLELRLMAHTTTMIATFFSARVGGSKPDKFHSAKYVEKHPAGFKVHTDNLYYYAAMTLLVATQELLHSRDLSLRGANEEHGERAIQDEHVDFMHITRSKCDLQGDQRMIIVKNARKSMTRKHSVRGLHNPLHGAVPILDVCRCSCLLKGEHQLQVIDPTTHAVTRELPVFSFNNRSFDRQLTPDNNTLVYLLRSGHTLFCVGKEPSALRAAVEAGQYVESFARAAHPDLLFLCVCDRCDLTPSIDLTSNLPITRDFNMHDLRTKHYKITGGVRLRRESTDTIGLYVARKVRGMVAAQNKDGELFFPLFRFRSACRKGYLRERFGPDTEAGHAFLKRVISKKQAKIATLCSGTNSWVTNFNLQCQIDSLKDVIEKRKLSNVVVPAIPENRVMKMDKRPLLADGTRGKIASRPRGKAVDPGYCRCPTRACKACVCVSADPPRACSDRCHGRAASELVCGNINNH